MVRVENINHLISLYNIFQLMEFHVAYTFYEKSVLTRVQQISNKKKNVIM